MCTPPCCDSIGSSPNLQMGYVLTCAWFALIFAVEFCVSLVTQESERSIPYGDELDVLRIITAMTTLCVVAVWFFALASRCCAPCCCGMHMEKVPEPCPCGECSLKNPRLLDYPFLFAFGGHVVSSVLLDGPVRMVFPWQPLEEVPRVSIHRLLLILTPIWILLALLGVCLGWRKYQLLISGAVLRSAPPAMVVGQPVSAPVPSGSPSLPDK
ncbi:unnamed protein product [Effrenium voratum]|uniref:Uncharacterized protein n=1 Tax=Effrenium voratum TaxID=2562239 RepID=A0AA36IY70_9DINO|nr:unnamed protein product [Effrenium voratum]